MHDTKERLSLFWIFAFLNYLYADVLALWDIVGSLNVAGAPHPHLPPWALKGVDRRDVHRSFFDYAPIGKQKLFSEHPVCQRL